MDQENKCSGKQGHDCSEVAEKVEMLLDGELDTATETRLIKEINKCSACLEHYKIDEAFKKFIANKFKPKRCAENLKSEILAKISSLKQGLS